MGSFPVVKIHLHAPSLEDVSQVLEKSLLKNFQTAKVSVIDCPDLCAEPYMLASRGLCGNPVITDIGGVPYLIPTPMMDKAYSFTDVPSWTEMEECESLMIGAGAAPAHLVGSLSEMIVNIKTNKSEITSNQTRICKVDHKMGGYKMDKISHSTGCVHIMNLFVSEGKPGKILEVRASKRIGELNLMEVLQSALKEEYKTLPVGLGGMFVLTKGKAHIHVMPGYSEVPLSNPDMVDNWLSYFEMSSPLTAMGYLVSHDPGYNLRMEHFHCFSSHGDGGHFHWDTTPDEAEYVGYFNIPQYLYRVDGFKDEQRAFEYKD